MRKILIPLILISILSLAPFTAFSETIDVFIKGVDDGVKTNKQQDYKEAVMNAKLQAIERAGVEISSITKVANFKLKYDMIESKAKAVLLPGFQIMDMDYQTDGTYQVVLSGKVRTGKGEPKTGPKSLMNMGKRDKLKGDKYFKKGEYKKAYESYNKAISHFNDILKTFPGSNEALKIEKEEIIEAIESIKNNKLSPIIADLTAYYRRFNEYDNGVVADTKTGLEWVATDKKISWYKALEWVKNLTIDGGGWSWPTIDELDELYMGELKTLILQRGIMTSNISTIRLMKASIWTDKIARFYDDGSPSGVWAYWFDTGSNGTSSIDKQYERYVFAVRSRR